MYKLDEKGDLVIEDQPLERTENGLRKVLLDEELDPFTVDFHYDGCATIRTEDLSYIKLGRGNLRVLLELIGDTEEIFENESLKRKKE